MNSVVLITVGLNLQVGRVVNRVRPVLLVLRNGRLTRDHLHFHGARQEQLLAFLVQRVAIDGTLGDALGSNKVVLQMHDRPIVYPVYVAARHA